MKATITAKFSQSLKTKTATKLVQLLHNRELLIFTPIYFSQSFVNLILKIRSNAEWTNGTLDGHQSMLMAFQFTNNQQSRLFEFLIPELFQKVFSLYPESSYALARLLFVFLAFMVFHFYLRKWFTQAESFTGVLFLSGSLAVTFLIKDLQESAPLLMLLFVLGLWALREKRDVLFCVLLLLGGGLTNETMLILATGYFFYRLPSCKLRPVLKTGLATTLIALPAFLTMGVIRYINRHQPHLGGAYHLPDNLRAIYFVFRAPNMAVFHSYYIYPFLVFSIFWLYAAIGYRKSPPFLKAMFWMIPFFIIAHLITGIIAESRQMIPLGFIVIPMSLFLIFPKDVPKAAEAP